MDQQSFIHNYIEETTPQFNKTLFTRDINKIIKGIEDIIFSIEREGNATIKGISVIMIRYGKPCMTMKKFR